MTSHIVIPDTQVRPGVPTDHLRWIGRYLVDRRPDVIVHLGDHWDMPSLSSYDRGKLDFEGRRYKADVEAGNAGLTLLDRSITWHNQRDRKAGPYEPRKVLLMGNHEYRIERARQEHAWLDGLVGLEDLNTRDWEVHDFLEPVFIDGVGYSHYWTNPMSGRPYGGQAITRLKQLGHSYVMGHQQILDFATRFVAGRKQTGIVAGASYLHDEKYLTPQGNHHWRGILVLHEVDQGSFDVMEVSLGYLCRRYEGVSLSTFLRDKYPDQRGVLWAPR